MIEKIRFELPEIGNSQVVTPPEVLTEFHRLAAHGRETLEFHMSQQRHKQLLGFVRDGDPQGVADWFRGQKSGLSFGKLSGDELQQLRFLFAGAITLYTHAAIEGGLEQEVARNLNNAYVHVAAAAKSPRRLKELLPLAGIDFAQRVDATRRSGIPAVNVCRAYVHSHLHYKISLADLAEACGLSPNYLSAIFRENTGIGLKEYILDEKLTAAGQALRTTDLSVAEVAFQFAFCSHSSFSAHFKRKFGVSPAKYRIMEQAKSAPMPY